MHYTLTYVFKGYTIGTAIFYADKIEAMQAYLNAVWYGHRNIILSAYDDTLHRTTIKPIKPTKDLPF